VAAVAAAVDWAWDWGQSVGRLVAAAKMQTETEMEQQVLWG